MLGGDKAGTALLRWLPLGRVECLGGDKAGTALLRVAAEVRLGGSGGGEGFEVALVGGGAGDF